MWCYERAHHCALMRWRECIVYYTAWHCVLVNNGWVWYRSDSRFGRSFLWSYQVTSVLHHRNFVSIHFLIITLCGLSNLSNCVFNCWLLYQTFWIRTKTLILLRTYVNFIHHCHFNIILRIISYSRFILNNFI